MSPFDRDISKAIFCHQMMRLVASYAIDIMPQTKLAFRGRVAMPFGWHAATINVPWSLSWSIWHYGQTRDWWNGDDYTWQKRHNRNIALFTHDVLLSISLYGEALNKALESRHAVKPSTMPEWWGTRGGRARSQPIISCYWLPALTFSIKRGVGGLWEAGIRISFSAFSRWRNGAKLKCYVILPSVCGIGHIWASLVILTA